MNPDGWLWNWPNCKLAENVTSPFWTTLEDFLLYVDQMMLISCSKHRKTCFYKEQILTSAWNHEPDLAIASIDAIVWQNSECGSVGRMVASSTRGPPFESRRQQNFVMDICTVECFKNVLWKIVAVIGPFAKVYLLVWAWKFDHTKPSIF